MFSLANESSQVKELLIIK